MLRTAEAEHFIPLLRRLNSTLLARTDERYQALKGSAWADAALRTVAYAGVASRLLDPGAAVPEYAAGLAEAEVRLIEGSSGVVPSPIFPGLPAGEDYTQYIPRGHYTLSDELSAYLKAMMWYGRMTFRLKTRDPAVGRDETRCALLLVNALRTTEVGGRPAMEAWADLDYPTVFFTGRSDDLTVLQYGEVMDRLYAPDAPVTILADEARLDEFIAEAYKLPPPRILGIVLEGPANIEEQTKGLRFMGQRFIPDGYVFDQLLFPNVGDNMHRRGLPRGLDLSAAMGSGRAYEILTGMGETAYERYPEQMVKVQSWVSGLSRNEWTETLYNTWLYTFRPLLEVPGEGYPTFMQSPAWLDKQLNTSLGSWTELRRDTLLYAKQFTPPPGGPGYATVLRRGCVEPVPAFYARLAALTALTRQGLYGRHLLDGKDNASLLGLEELSVALQAMAEKEQRGEALSEGEYCRLRDYGDTLKGLVEASANVEGGEGDSIWMQEEPQAAVVADIGTDPDGMTVLEEAVGRIDEIYVVVPAVGDDGSGTQQVAEGGVFSYYEFTWPTGDRLTDETWRAMLDEPPPRPEWVSSFFTTE